MSSMSWPRAERHERAAGALDDDDVGTRREPRVGRGDAVEVDRRARLARAARCGAIGGANAYGLHVGERRVDVARGAQRGDVGVHATRRRRCPRRPASCRPRATPCAASARSSATATRGLADAGVGAGDEDAASRLADAGGAHAAPRRACTIGVALRRARRRRPSTRGRRSPRTSPECGRRARIASSAASARSPAAAAHQPARPAARRVGRADRLQLAQQRAGVGVGQRDLLHVHHRDRRSPRATSMSPMSCMSMKRLDVRVRRRRAANARAQLLQRVGAERRERDEAADLQHATASRRARAAGRSTHCSARLLQTRSNATPANGSAAMSPQTNAGARAARAARAARSSRRAASGRRRARVARRREHRQRDVERDARAPADSAPRARPAPRRCRSRRRGSRAGASLHDVEPLRHARADLALQHRGRVVGRGGAREVPAHRARVERARIGRRRGGSVGHRGTPRARATNASRCDRNGACAAPAMSHEARVAACARASQRPAAGGVSVSRLAGDDERRLRDARRLGAQVGRRQHARAPPRASRGDGSPRANSALAQRRERRAAVLAALHLQRRGSAAP